MKHSASCHLLPALCLAIILPASAARAACMRFAPGSPVVQPEDLFSQNGVLTVSLSYQTSTDKNGNQLFCYVLPDGNQSPTLHLNPGDQLVLTLTNDTPVPTSSDTMKMQMTSPADQVCGAATMDPSSTNVHFHGTNTPPVCHQDEVIHTLINAGQTFTYDVQFPSDEPPGMYWYHPHAHGLSEAAVLGGATGAIIIDGIENVQPKVSGLPQRLLIVRDALVPGDPDSPPAPAKDLSLNFVPVPYPNYPPAVITMAPKAQEFWRVANTSADTILDLQVVYDRKSQPLKIVAFDGVAVGSQDGTRSGKIITAKDILVPPASRVEFIVKAPGPKVKLAQLMTLNVNTGPDGDNDPTRPLAAIQTAQTSNAKAMVQTPAAGKAPGPQRFEGLADAKPSSSRLLYFSEVQPTTPDGEPTFFITVDGQTPVAFNPDLPPAITTTQGAVEDWTIQNRSGENHEFHIHQIHFLLLRRNGVAVGNGKRQFFDTINVPFWKGKGAYPSVKVRMDFRGPTVGDFVYHCHILEHEDNGMMAIIRVLPAGTSTSAAAKPSAAAFAVKARAFNAPRCRKGKLVEAQLSSTGGE